jgi:carbonic anhydrase
VSDVAAAEALARLREGNDRFVRTLAGERPGLEHSGNLRLSPEGQRPMAAVLACSDSRVPVELVFDQGVGDLFVIRVAGNIVAESQLASVEFAVEQLGSRLVVVLGHTGCGAVRATVDAIAGRGADAAGHLPHITDLIRPALEALAPGPGDAGGQEPSAALLRQAESANVHRSVERLRSESPLLADRVASGRISIVGGTLELETGRVDFFGGGSEI